MSQHEDSLPSLQDLIFLSKVENARRTPGHQRVEDALQLFDDMIDVMRGGIRSQHPEYSDEKIENEVRRRLRIARAIDEAGLYHDAGVLDE